MSFSTLGSTRQSKALNSYLRLLKTATLGAWRESRPHIHCVRLWINEFWHSEFISRASWTRVAPFFPLPRVYSGGLKNLPRQAFRRALSNHTTPDDTLPTRYDAEACSSTESLVRADNSGPAYRADIRTYRSYLVSFCGRRLIF